MAEAAEGTYRLEYLRDNGWWVGHAGTDIPDVEKYIARVNAREDCVARAVNNFTGEIIGDAPAACSYCGVPHTGPEGSCLI